jgi:hypothetical protein
LSGVDTITTEDMIEFLIETPNLLDLEIDIPYVALKECGLTEVFIERLEIPSQPTLSQPIPLIPRLRSFKLHGPHFFYLGILMTMLLSRWQPRYKENSHKYHLRSVGIKIASSDEIDDELDATMVEAIAALEAAHLIDYFDIEDDGA